MKLIWAFFFCFSAVLINTNAFSNTVSPCEVKECLAVVDAGSTGSRLHLYSFDRDKTNTPIRIKELWSKKINPGFSTLEPRQEQIDNYLNTLFASATEQNIPVYFYATAGMRLLPQPKQQQLYALLQNWFQSNPNWQLRSSKTITGTEEGVFGWLAINYETGALRTNRAKLAGVLDIGGASTQVSFPVIQDSLIAQGDLLAINVYGKQFKVYVHSFLGLGQNEVSHQFLDTESCYSNDYTLPKGTPANGDAYQCMNEISNLMNPVHHVDQLVQPALEANPVSNWVAMGAVADLVKSKPFHSNSRQFTTQNLLDQADSQICHQRWSTLGSLYPNDDYLYGYCLFPAYYYALITQGYGIQNQQPIKIMAPSQSADWTLGVVLNNQPKSMESDSIDN